MTATFYYSFHPFLPLSLSLSLHWENTFQIRDGYTLCLCLSRVLSPCRSCFPYSSSILITRMIEWVDGSITIILLRSSIPLFARPRIEIWSVTLFPLLVLTFVLLSRLAFPQVFSRNVIVDIYSLPYCSHLNYLRIDFQEDRERSERRDYYS